MKPSFVQPNAHAEDWGLKKKLNQPSSDVPFLAIQKRSFPLKSQATALKKLEGYVKKKSAIFHTSYLSFFLHGQNFWRIKFTPKKRVNYDKIHGKLPIFCVITAKYTVNCQFFALNL